MTTRAISIVGAATFVVGALPRAYAGLVLIASPHQS
jgi:hypothetical protein